MARWSRIDVRLQLLKRGIRRAVVADANEASPYDLAVSSMSARAMSWRAETWSTFPVSIAASGIELSCDVAV